jgi:hypothetical protein
MPEFILENDCREALTRLFETDEKGHLRFGWSGQSFDAIDHSDFLAGPVRFRDYIMEGFVTYTIMVEESGPRCLIRVQGGGSNRGWSIRPQVRHYIKAAGLTIASEDDADQDVPL